MAVKSIGFIEGVIQKDMIYALGCSASKNRAMDRAVLKYSEGVAQIMPQQCAKSPTSHVWLCQSGLEGVA
jgi:hypothetical protein